MGNLGPSYNPADVYTVLGQIYQSVERLCTKRCTAFYLRSYWIGWSNGTNLHHKLQGESFAVLLIDSDPHNWIFAIQGNSFDHWGMDCKCQKWVQSYVTRLNFYLHGDQDSFTWGTRGVVWIRRLRINYVWPIRQAARFCLHRSLFLHDS